MFIENVGSQTLDEYLPDNKFYIIKIIYANEASIADVENNNSQQLKKQKLDHKNVSSIITLNSGSFSSSSLCCVHNNPR